jgi:DNA-binding Lrp family transcriptional regulator
VELVNDAVGLDFVETGVLQIPPDQVIAGHVPAPGTALVRDDQDRDTVERFEAEIAGLDEVIEVRRMFGLPDYVVRVGTPDLETYEAFVTAGLGAVPGIAKVDSHLTMKVVKSPERPPAPRAGRPLRVPR